MPRFRKKPVEIVARQYDGSESSARALIEWMGRGKYLPISMALAIETLEGVMRAEPRDWIIQGVQGEFYPCKPEIFEITYERLDY